MHFQQCHWPSYPVIFKFQLKRLNRGQISNFSSKGDKLSSSAECRIRTQGLRHQITSRLNARWQTDWAMEDQAKKNWTARPYDQGAFSPIDPTGSCLSHLALAIYMFVVVNFDALAQASDIPIDRRQAVYLCWMQDSNPRSQTPNASGLNARWQTDWAIEVERNKLWFQVKRNTLWVNEPAYGESIHYDSVWPEKAYVYVIVIDYLTIYRLGG